MQMTFSRMNKPGQMTQEYTDPAIGRPPLLSGKPMGMKPPTGMAETLPPRPPRNPPLGPSPAVDPAMASAFQAQHGIAPSAMPPDVQRLIPGQRPVEIAPPTGMQTRPMRPYMPRDRGLR